MARADTRGLGNVEIVTADINTFEAGRRFDRVVSIEMFEHVRNYERLLHRISGWLHAGRTALCPHLLAPHVCVPLRSSR